MRILIAIDESPYSEGVLNLILRRKFPNDSQLKLLVILEPLDPLSAGHLSPEQREHISISRHNSALEFCRYAEKEIREKMPTAIFHHEIREGDAREEILDVASKWFADTILIGEWNHEYSRCPSMGSVSRAIATHAPCSVEIVREKQAVTTT